MRTASSHISCALRRLGISFIQHGTFESKWPKPSIILQKKLFPLNALIFYLYNWTRARVKFYGPFKKNFYIWSQDTKKSMFMSIFFFVSFFSSSETYQSHHLDGCQAVRINSSFILAFWALPFLYPSYHSISLNHHHNNHRHHPIALSVVVSQTNQGHTPVTLGLPQLPYHTFLRSYTDQGQATVTLGLPQLPYHTFLGSYTDQGHVTE